MIVRDLFLDIPDRGELLRLYNETFDEITPHTLDSFLALIMAVEVRPCGDDIKVVVKRDDRGEVDIAGEGWGHYDGVEWAHMDRWDVEWRPAAEVLGLELEDRSDLSYIELFMWMMEELGVYFGRPRT